MITAAELIAKLQKLDPQTRILASDSEWGASNVRGIRVQPYIDTPAPGGVYWDTDDKNKPRDGQTVAIVTSENQVKGDGET